MSIYTSLLTAGTNSHEETSENANGLATDLMSPGVVGAFTSTTGGFLVTAQGTPDMTVAVAAGVAYVTATPTSQNSQTLRVRNTASTNATISANSSGSTKYDWVYIKVDASKAATPAVNADDVATIVTSRSSSNTTDNGTPPTYGTLLAIVTVANGASSITSGNITPKRTRAVAVGGINDSNGNEVVKVSATSSAVNEVTVTNAATGSAPQVGASGDDTNIDLRLVPKGTGNIKRGASGGSIDWWEEIARTTLAVAGDTITVSSIPARKYLKIIFMGIATGGTLDSNIRYNNDSSALYSYQGTLNGAFASAVTQTGQPVESGTVASGGVEFSETAILNIATLEKIGFMSTSSTGTTGSGSSPVNITAGVKWSNTSAQISRVDAVNTGTGDFAIGSEIVVLGHD